VHGAENKSERRAVMKASLRRRPCAAKRPYGLEDGAILEAPGRGQLPRFKSRRESDRGTVVRAGGLEPPQALRPNGFSYRFGFRRPASRSRVFWSVRGLDYPFTIPRESGGKVLPV